jgi:selenide, water dikinase
VLKDPNLLVGFETSDDAAVYRLSADTAVISTVDFITPPVDDPYWFGQIAAANSLSDVYAMGGRPILALNLVMYPSKALDMGLLKEILRGGSDKVAEAGACMAGGHSVDDNEPKYGLAVTGIVHPDRILTNAGARPGDALVLTKPLGTGVLFNANRSGKLPYRDLEALLPSIAALNGPALDAARPYDVHACTDITGFGLLGHCLEMARGSATRIHVSYRRLPFHPQAPAMYRRGETTGSNPANRKAVEGSWELQVKLSAAEEELLFDPQTSGGLLLAVPDSQADDLVRSLQAAGMGAAARVAEVMPGDRAMVSVG